MGLIAFHLTILYLRLFQVIASAIAGYTFCYLIWHHNNHYCAYNPARCDEEQLTYARVPFQYALAVLTYIIIFLALVLHTPFTYISHRIQLKYHLLSDGLAIIFLALTQGLLFSVPDRSPICRYHTRDRSVEGPVVETNCVVFASGETANGIALGLTFIIWIVVFSRLVFEKHRTLAVKGGSGQKSESEIGVLARSSAGDIMETKQSAGKGRELHEGYERDTQNSQMSAPSPPLHHPPNFGLLHDPEDDRPGSGSVSSVEELQPSMGEMIQVRRNLEGGLPPLMHHTFQDFDADFHPNHPNHPNPDVAIHIMETANHRRHLSRISEELPRDADGEEVSPPELPPSRQVQATTLNFREHGSEGLVNDTSGRTL